MHRSRLWGAVAAVAVTAIAMGEWPVMALAPAAGREGREAFSPLYSLRLEIGVRGLSAPPGRDRIAALPLYDDTEFIASAQPASACIGSACLKSYCLGSACGGSQCLGSGCTGSACLGSLCGASGCLGSVCLGSACLGSVCTICTATEPVEPEA